MNQNYLSYRMPEVEPPKPPRKPTSTRNWRKHRRNVAVGVTLLGLLSIVLTVGLCLAGIYLVDTDSYLDFQYAITTTTPFAPWDWEEPAPPEWSGDDYDTDYDYEEFDSEITIPQAAWGDGTTLTLVGLDPSENPTFQQIYKAVNPSIVAIHGYDYQDDHYGMSLGTGVIMSEDGYIVTNHHVIEGSDEVEVELEDGTLYQAMLVGYDEDTDLAVLKVQARDLPVATFGDSDLVEVGDTVVAIGNPAEDALRGTMTDGIISAINRDIEVGGYQMTLMQTSAALNQGNSGGALINADGQVIGITNMKFISNDADENIWEGLGFAIPSQTVKTVVDDLIACGHVTGRLVLGITVQPLLDLEMKKMEVEHGLWVREITPNGAAEGRLQLDDIILTANGIDLHANDDLLAIRDGLEIGESIQMEVLRNGEVVEVTITPVDAWTLG